MPGLCTLGDQARQRNGDAGSARNAETRVERHRGKRQSAGSGGGTGAAGRGHWSGSPVEVPIWGTEQGRPAKPSSAPAQRATGMRHILAITRAHPRCRLLLLAALAGPRKHIAGQQNILTAVRALHPNAGVLRRRLLLAHHENLATIRAANPQAFLVVRRHQHLPCVGWTQLAPRGWHTPAPKAGHCADSPYYLSGNRRRCNNDGRMHSPSASPFRSGFGSPLPCAP